MELTKAIELNKESEASLRDNKFIDHANAVRLGIEALIFKQRWEKGRFFRAGYLLPGETKAGE